MKYLRKILPIIITLSAVSCGSSSSDGSSLSPGGSPVPPKCCDSVPSGPASTKPLFTEEGKTSQPHLSSHEQSKKKESFNPDRVLIVDQLEGNLLVRGNTPTIEGKFAYSELKEAVNDILKKKKQALNPNFILIDVSLLYEIGDGGILAIERKWFQDNAKLGCFWNKPVLGAPISPTIFNSKERTEYFKKLDMHNISDFIDELHTLLNTKCANQMLIYIHCHSGINSTGEIIACYKMEFLGKSYDDVIKADDSIGNIHTSTKNSIQWYAFYLRDKKNVTSVGKIEGK